ncbi:MAG: malto-oligosyltrehalose trehalohydrolase [Gemmatimonadaceae bacterium]
MLDHSLAFRRLPVGAELAPDGATHFRVWAPRRRSVAVRLEADCTAFPLEREAGGYHSGFVQFAPPGTRYRLQLDDAGTFPDPVSRFQPEGPHGPSVVVDPGAFAWSDDAWRGVAPEDRVLYEMHVGTFTTEGTWAAAVRELPALSELGATVIELMPVAEFAGRFGWGYDGVDLFAPTHLYGTPDDFRSFVDAAHALGLGVILDVVYNHLGPDGNYLPQFAEQYFSTRYTTDWGDALNFDGPCAEPVRELCLANVRHWIGEYHLDGLRIDATQNMYDSSARHIICDVAECARATAPGRTIFIVAENEPQETRLLRAPADEGFGLDAVWNDDWHHSAAVALTGRTEAYYTDYRGTASELVAAAKYGFLYQGQWYAWQAQPRGTPTFGLEPWRFVHFLQNHDQIANSLRGDRVHKLTSPSRLRALTALLLLGQQTPMLFQGQEFTASSPFLYFADHNSELMGKVQKGRAAFLSQFESIAAVADERALADPGDPSTFLRSRLDHTERVRHASSFALHRDLLALRRSDPVLGSVPGVRVDGAVLARDAFVLRYFAPHGDDRLLVLNLGGSLALDVLPEPLLAPPAGREWRLRWSSEDPAYGGSGTPELPTRLRAWRITGGSALVLAPAENLSHEGRPAHG